MDKNVYFMINVGNIHPNMLYKSSIAPLNSNRHVLEFFDQYFQSSLQYCLSVLEDSEVRSYKCDFFKWPIEKSLANLSQAAGRPQVSGNQTDVEKFCVGNSWYSLTYEVEHCPAATNFCPQISLAGTQTVE